MTTLIPWYCISQVSRVESIAEITFVIIVLEERARARARGREGERQREHKQVPAHARDMECDGIKRRIHSKLLGKESRVGSHNPEM